ncbi:DUF2845 domain-containing protein [Alteromonas sp. S015]|uniref:DUF2845 domain-containing protein n=1 Tax=Alteromonas sp. S015 TaxID=3117401 RepID=UPI002FDF3AC3
MRKILILMISIISFSTSAEGFRCGVRLVELKDSLGVVKEKCGSPKYDVDMGSVVVDGQYVNLKRLTYDLGKGKFLRILDFHNGILEKISDGPRSE